MSEVVFLDAPLLGEPEKRWLSQAVDDGFVSTAGPFVGEFEAKFARRLGCGSVAMLQSGTAALQLALLESGVGPGDEVILPDLTFAATANAVEHVGAKVVLADVDPDSWTLDPVSVASRIGPRTKAILPVHLYGVPADMTRLGELALEHGLSLVEDATEALDARWNGEVVGTIGDFGAFSFNGNKAMTTGGGGALVGKDASKVAHARFLANQARDEKRGYFHPEIGFNYRMTNIEAALGLAQLEGLDRFQATRREHAAMFRQELSSIPGLEFQQIPVQATSSFWMSAVLLPEGRDPETVRKALLDRGVQSRRLFHPLSAMPPWEGRSPRSGSVSQRLFERGLCLPSSPRNTPEGIERACRALREILA